MDKSNGVKSIFDCYREVQTERLLMLKQLLSSLGKSIIEASKKIPYEKLREVMEESFERYIILGYYDEDVSSMIFSIVDYHADEDDEFCLGWIKFYKKNFKALNQFLKKYYPGIILGNHYRFFMDDGTVEFEFEFNSELTVEDFTADGKLRTYPDTAIADKEKNRVFNFTNDLIKLENGKVITNNGKMERFTRLEESIPGEDIPKRRFAECSQFYVSQKGTNVIEQAFFEVRIQIEDPLEV